MSSTFPKTPVTLLARMADRSVGRPWQDAWQDFWNLYHLPLRMTVLAQFQRHGWNSVSETLLEDVLADVVTSFLKSGFTYRSEQGKLRDYLSRLAQRRVVDHLRRSMREMSRQEELERRMESAPPILPGPDNEAELEAYRQALLATLLEDVRARVSPQTFFYFDLIKLQGKSPAEVANEFQVKRNLVDNAVRRVVNHLQTLVALPEYKEFLDP